jgi:hypothetical protein
MTTEEFSNEFDILYDSIASLGAPDLDQYEKSVFLTKAQLELVKEYNGPINKYQRGFEGSDKRRADLRELVVDYSIVPVLNSKQLGGISHTAVLPDNLFLIKYEQAGYTNPPCEDVLTMAIIPVKYDEYAEAMGNPFRKPDFQNGFRLDIESKNGVKTVELITDRVITSYRIRYVKYPTPIVLTDLGEISDDLSVDGVKVKTACLLDAELHREILDRAVELAMLAYKPEALPSKVQLDQRNN